jgi:chromate transport protein ChrA
LGAGFVFSTIFLLPGLRVVHLLRAIPRNAALVFGATILVMAFLLSFLMVWLYAAIRNRFKSGPKTAAALGASLALIMAVLQYAGWRLALDRVPGRAWFLNALVMLIALVIASLFGAWIYDRPSQETFN